MGTNMFVGGMINLVFIISLVGLIADKMNQLLIFGIGVGGTLIFQIGYYLFEQFVLPDQRPSIAQMIKCCKNGGSHAVGHRGNPTMATGLASRVFLSVLVSTRARFLCCQRHRVQLNPLWHLPTSPIDARNAYLKRRIICTTERDNQRHEGVPTGFYDGWTLFAFQLSAAKMNDAAGLAHERWEMIPSRLVDPDFITIYESSGYWQPYYTTSMGLYLQAIMHGNAEPR